MGHGNGVFIETRVRCVLFFFNHWKHCNHCKKTITAVVETTLWKRFRTVWRYI